MLQRTLTKAQYDYPVVVIPVNVKQRNDCVNGEQILVVVSIYNGITQHKRKGAPHKSHPVRALGLYVDTIELRFLKVLLEYMAGNTETKVKEVERKTANT